MAILSDDFVERRARWITTLLVHAHIGFQDIPHMAFSWWSLKFNFNVFVFRLGTKAYFQLMLFSGTGTKEALIFY
jgi:hypothetical protein